MAQLGTALLFVFSSLALIAFPAEGLHCWVCSSDANSACLDPFNTTSRQYLVTDCDRDRGHSTYLSTPAVCRKYIQKLNKDSDEVVVVRSCAWGSESDPEGPCSPSKLHFISNLVSCSICTTDECNSATGLQSLALLLALPASLLVARLL